MAEQPLSGPLRAERRPIALVVALQLAQSVAVLLVPGLGGQMIDTGLADGTLSRVGGLGVAAVVLSLLQLACTAAAVHVGAGVAMSVGRALRERVFSRALDAEPDAVRRIGTAGLVTRTTNDVQQVQMLFLTTLTLSLPAPFVAIGSAVMALREDAGVSMLLLAVLVPLLAVGLALIVARTVPRARAQQTALDAVGRFLREQIEGVRPVRAFVQQRRMHRDFDRHGRTLRREAAGAGRLTTALLPFVTTALNLSTVLAVWLSWGRIQLGEMTVGASTAVITYLLFLATAVLTATSSLMTMPRARVSLRRIREVLDLPSAVAPPLPDDDGVPNLGRLELRSVRYHYGGAPEAVLDDVDLTVRPGTTTALTGGTGSGKSTVLRLAAGLAGPTGGRVRLDGVDVRSLRPEVRARLIGVVPQNPYLFSGTVRANLSLVAHAPDDELWEALEIAQAAPFVRGLDDGLDAPVAQGGANFSGGQQQRLAVARALVARPLVYVFDDPSSALDQATDAAIWRDMDRRRPDATILLASQRIATVARADRVVVLERGHVVGTGVHAGLLASCAAYRVIAESQQNEEVARA